MPHGSDGDGLRGLDASLFPVAASSSAAGSVRGTPPPPESSAWGRSVVALAVKPSCSFGGVRAPPQCPSAPSWRRSGVRLPRAPWGSGRMSAPLSAGGHLPLGHLLPPPLLVTTLMPVQARGQPGPDGITGTQRKNELVYLLVSRGPLPLLLHGGRRIATVFWHRSGAAFSSLGAIPSKPGCVVALLEDLGSPLEGLG